jgi:hypothetical protein
MHIPDLRTASRRADRAAAQQWREERRAMREEGDTQPLQMAVITDGSDRGLADAVRDGGADVLGLLAPDAAESLAWAAEAQADHGYGALDALASDAVEAACLDLALPEACRVATLLLEEGVSVVMARPELPDRADTRALLDAASVGSASAVIGLRTRAWPSLATAFALAPGIRPLTQVTVLQWPAGRVARAELCDLVRRLCGDVLAVCASAAAMPAHELAPAAPVTLALLTADGTTVLVNESPRALFGDARLTFVGAGGRMVVDQRRLTMSDTAGIRDVALDPAPDPVSLATEGLRDELIGVPSRAAGLGDALAAARLLELAAQSYERDTWVEA